MPTRQSEATGPLPSWLAAITTGQVIIDRPASGVWNMAVDEELLDRPAVFSSACLRWYAWEEPTLSLGYFQDVQARQSHPGSLGCPVVRRASGGGALIHDREVTYSLVIPRAPGQRGDTHDLYLFMHQLWVHVLRRLGVSAVCGASPDDQGESPFLCFQRLGQGDVLVAGHKVIGSAQRRGRHAVLQHGSILLAQSLAAPELPGIFELSGRSIEPHELMAAMMEELPLHWPVSWQRFELSPEDRRRVQQRVEERFGDPRWTNRR